MFVEFFIVLVFVREDFELRKFTGQFFVGTRENGVNRPRWTSDTTARVLLVILPR